MGSINPVLVGGAVFGSVMLLIVALLVRNAVKRGRAEGVNEFHEDQEEQARRQLHEMANGRHRGRDLLNRLSKH